MAAAFPFTSPSAGTETSSHSSSSSGTTPTFTNGGWTSGSNYTPFGTNAMMIANMVAASNTSSSSANSMICDKCRQMPDSLGDFHTLPCLHTLCRKCFQTQGNFHVPNSNTTICPICNSGAGAVVGGDDQTTMTTSASFFQNFPSFNAFSSSGVAANRREQIFSTPSPASDNYNNVARNTPAQYLFNEQLNVDTSLFLGSLLDSVSMHDDVLQMQPKGIQMTNQPRPSSGSTSSKFPITSVSSSSSNHPFGFRVLGGAVSPPFHHPPLPQSRNIQQQQQQQQIFSLAVGGHRSSGVPFMSSQQQQQQPQSMSSLQISKMPATSSSSSSNFTTNLPVCSICPDGVEAACRCDDCSEYLCAKCVQAHLRVRLTKEHRIVTLFQQQNQISTPHSPASGQQSISNLWTIAGSPSSIQQSRQQAILANQQQSPMIAGGQKAIGRQAAYCSQHQFEPMTFYCETCSESLCRFCTANNVNHPFPSHRITSLSAKNAPNESGRGGEKSNAQGEMTPLNQLFTDSRQCVRVLDEAVRGVDHMTERVETRMHSVSNEIRAIIHHHIGALEERKRELLERVDAVRTAKLGALNSQKDELRKYLTTSKNSLEQAEKLFKQQKQDDGGETMSRVRNLLQDQLQVLKSSRPCLQPQEDDQLSFSAPDASILKTVRLLGNIITGAYAANCTLLGDPVRRAIRDKPIYYTVQARDHVGEQLTNGGDQVNAFVVATNGVGDSNTIDPAPLPVDVYDKKNGTYLCRYEPSQEGEHQVHIFVRGCPIRGSPFTLIVRRGRDYTTIGATPILSFGGEGTGDGQLCRPWGICCDKQGRIVIADRSNSRIQVFDQEGKFLFKFGSPGCRNGQFDRPAGVTVNSKNQLVIVDKDNHRVQVFTADGQFLFKFGEKGRGNGQFNYPWDVAVSSNDDSIAISDTRNHRVQLFDSRGTYVNKFGFESSLFYKQFDSPRGLVFAPDGRLFCTDFNNHRLAVIDVVHNQMEFFGREGEYDGAFKRPQGLDMDLEGHLIIADSRNNRVQVFTPQLTFLCSFGIEGYPPRGRSVMDRPCDVCVCEGKIFVVDFGNNKIHIY